MVIFSVLNSLVGVRYDAGGLRIAMQFPIGIASVETTWPLP
jgi:hypothetical protein